MGFSLSDILLAPDTYTETGSTDTRSTPEGCRGALFFINVTAATGSLDLKLQALDIASGEWVTLATVTTITEAGMSTVFAYPVATAVCLLLPANYKWLYTLTDTPSFDFSISATYLN